MAIPVYLIDGSKPEIVVKCSGETVCDLLEKAGVSIAPLDRVLPPPQTPLEPGMRVQITRVEAVDLASRREIPSPVSFEADPLMRRGQVQVVEAGTPGIVEDTTRVYYLNGQESSRVQVGSRTVVEPTRRITKVGTQSVPQLISRGGLISRSVMTMDSTAYDPGPGSCGASADGLTATGQRATRGVCAVDPRVIPLGTRLWVEGYGFALACDTGGAIHGNRIDVCFDTRAEAMRWGRRTVMVYILD
jgi:3D (Asp-Asp-Asp) domain-containing protein